MPGPRFPRLGGAAFLDRPLGHSGDGDLHGEDAESVECVEAYADAAADALEAEAVDECVLEQDHDQ
ncbi:hypothetical protein GCM10029992_23300 [Glycomyces albus]